MNGAATNGDGPVGSGAEEPDAIVERRRHRLGRRARHAAGQDAWLPRPPDPDVRARHRAGGRAHRHRCSQRAGRARGHPWGVGGGTARCARAGRAAGRHPALARVLARPRRRVSAPGRHAAGGLSQARRAGARLSHPAPHRRPGRRGHARRRADRVLLRPHGDAGAGGRAATGRRPRHAGRLRAAAGPGAGAVPALHRAAARARPRPHRSAQLARARGLRRAQRPRRRHRPGARGDRRLRPGARVGRAAGGQGAALLRRCACRSCATWRGRAHCRRRPPGSAALR